MTLARAQAEITAPEFAQWAAWYAIEAREAEGATARPAGAWGRYRVATKSPRALFAMLRAHGDAMAQSGMTVSTAGKDTGRGV